MAEPTSSLDEMDEMLSGSLKRTAHPGEPAGVADAIRARVASGDVGTPAPSGSAPGWGSSLGWIPWVGGIVVLGLVGATLGVSGVFGHPIDTVTVSTSSILMPPTVQASSCPDGPVVTSVDRGSRVIALARSSNGAEVQVRNPLDVAQLVWIPASELDSDSGQAAVASLPIGPDCPTVFVAQAPVVPVTPEAPVTPVTPGKPKPGPGPAPAPDTSAPTIVKPTVDNPPNAACYARVSVTASDNVAVTSVSITWTGVNTGSGQMTATGGHWQYILQGNTSNTYSGNTTFVVVAHDAAGNSSPANSATYYVQCFG